MNILEKKEKNKYSIDYHLVDGSGAGVTIEPIAFLAVTNGTIKLLPVNHDSSLDKLVDYVPDLLNKVGDAISTMKDKNKCIEKLKNKIEKEVEKEKEKEEEEQEEQEDYEDEED